MQNKLQLVDYVKSLLTLKNPAHLCKCKTNPYVSNAYHHHHHHHLIRKAKHNVEYIEQ